MTDLIQATGAGLAAGTLRDEQRADRFDVPVRGFRDPRRPARQRGAGGFDRVDRIGLAEHAANLSVGAINFDHDETARLEIAREARAIGAGPFDADASHGAERTQPIMQLGEPGGGRGERLDPEDTAVRVECGAHMIVEVGVDSTNVRARRIYDGHCHPFSLQRLRGGTHVPGRRPCRDGCANSRLGHPPERGVPNSSTVRSTGAPIKRALRQVRSNDAHRRPRNREQRRTQSHWQLWTWLRDRRDAGR